MPKELEESKIQYRILEEEIKMAKSELSNVSLRLAEALRNNDDPAKSNMMAGKASFI